MFDLTTIGDATIDTFLILDESHGAVGLDKQSKKLTLHYGDKIPIIDTDQSVGGNAANVAVGLARQGKKVAIATALGDDFNGHDILATLEDEGIDTALSRLIPRGVTRYSVILNVRGERTVLSAHVKRSYTVPKIQKTRWIYYTSLGPTFEKIQDGIVAYKKKHPETLLAANPGSYQCKQKNRYFEKCLPHLDLLFVNKEEGAWLSKKQEIREIIQTLHKKGVRVVVMTDGEHGSWASDGTTIFSMPMYPIHAIAKTGAGDAFASGFLGAYMDRPDIESALKAGAANAAGVIQKIGAQTGLLSKKGIQGIIKKFPKVIPKKIG